MAKILRNYETILICSHCGHWDKDGNYVAVSRSKDSTTGTPTGKTFTDTKGNIFPVLITKAGKLYVIRTSPKTGKQYKQYLKIDE